MLAPLSTKEFWIAAAIAVLFVVFAVTAKHRLRRYLKKAARRKEKIGNE